MLEVPNPLAQLLGQLTDFGGRIVQGRRDGPSASGQSARDASAITLFVSLAVMLPVPTPVPANGALSAANDNAEG